MRVGKLDFEMKDITFRPQADEKKHWIGFRYSWYRGIREVWFDGRPAEIIDAYPSLPKAIQRYALIIFLDLKFKIKNFVRKIKGLHQSDK